MVGGTGMLAGVSMELSRRFEVVTVLARRPERLLLVEAAPHAGHLNLVAVDYHDSQRLTASLAEAVSAYGPLGLAVVWIHSTAPDAPAIVGRFVEGPYVHVLSSGRRDLRAVRARWDFMPIGNPELYRTVWLGFVETEDGDVRWLTDDEISGGVLHAIASGQRSCIVGQIERRASPR